MIFSLHIAGYQYQNRDPLHPLTISNPTERFSYNVCEHWNKCKKYNISCHLCPCLSDCLFLWYFPPKRCMHCSSPTHASAKALPKSTNHEAPRYTVFPPSSHFLPLSPQNLPQHLALEHTQNTFCPQCDRPSTIPTQNTTICCNYLDQARLVS